LFNIIRYPGSKAKIWSWIERHCPPEIRYGKDSKDGNVTFWAGNLRYYCEPFIGSCAITQRILQALRGNKFVKIILNDKDCWLANLWKSVRDAPHELTRRVQENTKLSADDFYRTKQEDGDETVDPVEAGFRKLVLHRSSFSGLGAMAGGPLGGKSQRSKYTSSCRWTWETIVDSIGDAHRLMTTFRGRLAIHSTDFENVLAMVPQEETSFVYLDPPYFKQGEALYKYAFNTDDHHRLADLLKNAKYQFALSYDGCDEIKALYKWAHIRQFNMTPTVQTSKEPRRKNEELVITNY
jgi:DNA adenine methylase